MSEDITEASGERGITVRPSMALATRNRPRGMWGQLTTSVLRPGLFYKTLVPASETRQWLWAAILILTLVGISTVRYSALSNAATGGGGGGMIDPGFVDPGFIDPGMGGDFGGIGGDFGGVPPGGSMGGDSGGGQGASTLTQDLTMALLAGANIVLGWVVLTLMLVVVPMLRGRAPRVGQNLQIAVWSSLPFAIMAIVQLLYWSGGGELGQPGVQGLLNDWKGFSELGSMEQALLISLTSRLTIFWLWSLMLVYFGARFALGGWRIVAFLLVLAWAAIQVIAPVVTESITAPGSDDTSLMPSDGPMGEMPLDMEFPSDDMGGDMGEPSFNDDIAPEATDEFTIDGDEQSSGVDSDLPDENGEPVETDAPDDTLSDAADDAPDDDQRPGGGGSDSP